MMRIRTHIIIISALIILLAMFIRPIQAEDKTAEVNLKAAVVTYFQDVPANTPTTIDAREQAGVVLEDFTSTEPVRVVINRYEINPHPEARFPRVRAAPLGIYIGLTANVSEFTTTIKVFYTDEEVTDAGLVEKTLRLYYFDGSAWVRCLFRGRSVKLCWGSA